MKRFNLLRTITFLILSYGVFSGGSCLKNNGTQPDDLCGEIKEWVRHFEPLNYYSTRVDNGFREFIYTDTSSANDICTEEHVNAYFSAHTKLNSTLPPDSLKVFGEAYWSFFGNSDIMEYSPSTIPYTYSGYLNIGLKQAFKGQVGSVGLQIVIRFPTRGDIKLDQDYLNAYIDEVELRLNYREYI
jgi:hypothetical protein